MTAPGRQFSAARNFLSVSVFTSVHVLPLLMWRPLAARPMRTTLMAGGVAFAVFLMAFQGSLLVGFVRASQSTLRAMGGDVWIMARGVTCFEFGAPLRASLAGRIAGIEGVRSVDPVVVGFSVLTREDQQRRAVLVLGVDHPTAWTPLRSSHPQSATIDHSAKSLLGMNDTITTGEVNGQRVRIDRSLDAGGSFMGTPLLAGRLDTARDWLGLDHRLATFLTVSLHSSQNAAAVAAAIRREHPEIDAQEREVFAEAASRFWLTQTGAGGGILLAGVLGFAIGLAVVSQTLFAHTVDHLDDYATFLAIGGTHRQTTAIVMGQGLVVGAIGSVAGVSLLWPAVTAARASLVSWIAVAWWMPVLSVALGLGMAMLAAAASVRKLRLVDPAQVFRS